MILLKRNQNSLNNLTFNYPKHTIKVGGYLIPILVDMKNIYPEQNNELKIGLIQEEDVMSFEYDRVKVIDSFSKKLNHINVEDKLYDNFSKNFLEYYKLKKVRDLLYILDEADILTIISHINKIIPIMINEFRKRLYESLKLDEKEPYIDYKDKNPMPDNIKDYLIYTDFYILCQAIIEYNPTPFFKENIGKSIDEWSLREYETHMAYLTAKNKFETIQHKWFASHKGE